MVKEQKNYGVNVNGEGREREGQNNSPRVENYL